VDVGDIIANGSDLTKYLATISRSFYENVDLLEFMGNVCGGNVLRQFEYISGVMSNG
jgi:hypothetical protein